jgi:hypothetical protein
MAALLAALAWGCGSPPGEGGGSTGTDGGTGGGGTLDGGTDGGTGHDGGTGGGSDGGVPDAGSITFPSLAGWAFYGPQNNGPQDVYDAAMDQGGNLWVAGGTEGLFLLKQGATKFVKFGIADGLHPYGYLTGDMAKFKGVPDGSPADPNPSLSATPVISVAGGKAGTVFVGYQGKPNCENAWTWDCGICAQRSADGLTCLQCAQGTPPSTWGDPAVYKSGDADRVTLNQDGQTLSVTHYDIFSGPNVVGGEPGGREKLCSVLRMAWDPAKDEIVFGANHGFAIGKASWVENPTCGGEYSGSQQHADCVGVYEHSHPAINGCASDNFPNCPNPVYLTDNYYGVAVDPTNHDLWMGGLNRSTKFHLWSYGGGLGGFYQAQADTENAPGAPCQGPLPCGVADRWDLWPDAVPEWTKASGINYVTPSQRNDDDVSAIAAMPDGTAWVSSFAYGLVHINTFGNVIGDATSKMLTHNLSSLALDPRDGSLWAGMQYGLGISRYNPNSNSVTNYSLDTLGDVLGNSTVANVQSFGSGGGRSMIVSWRKTGKTPGAVGVYTGN